MKIGDKIRVQTIRIEYTEDKKAATGRKKKPTKEGTIVAIYPNHVLVKYENYKESITFNDIFYPYDVLVTVKQGKEWTRLERTDKKNFKELGWC